MVVICPVLLFVGMLLISCGEKVVDPVREADTVWTNGVIYTADEIDTFAEAVAAKDGVILFVGSVCYHRDLVVCHN